MKFKKERDFIDIFGKQGSGKSYLTKKYVIPTLAKKKPVFIIDTMGEYTGQDRDVDYSPKQVFKDARDMLGFLIENKGVPGKGVYVLEARSTEACNLFFKIMNQAAMRCSIVVEEADKFCSSHKINFDLGELIDYGRHHDCDLIFLARRAAKVHKDVTSQADVIVSFRQTELNDIDALRKVWAAAEQLPDLQEHHFLCMGDTIPRTLKLFKPGDIKKFAD